MGIISIILSLLTIFIDTFYSLLIINYFLTIIVSIINIGLMDSSKDNKRIIKKIKSIKDNY